MTLSSVPVSRARRAQLDAHANATGKSVQDVAEQAFAAFFATPTPVVERKPLPVLRVKAEVKAPMLPPDPVAVPAMYGGRERKFVPGVELGVHDGVDRSARPTPTITERLAVLKPKPGEHPTSAPPQADPSKPTGAVKATQPDGVLDFRNFNF